MTDPASLLTKFDQAVRKNIMSAANELSWLSSQTAISDVEFAEAITLACRPVCNLDVPFILAGFLQSTSYEKATNEVERWTIFRGSSSLAPPSQDFRRQVLKHLSYALRSSLCE